jgi:hypothetical protein
VLPVLYWHFLRSSLQKKDVADTLLHLQYCPQIGFYLYFGFIVYQLASVESLHFQKVGIGIIMPVIAIILTILAIRRIGADEALVRRSTGLGSKSGNHIQDHNYKGSLSTIYRQVTLFYGIHTI